VGEHLKGQPVTAMQEGLRGSHCQAQPMQVQVQMQTWSTQTRGKKGKAEKEELGEIGKAQDAKRRRNKLDTMSPVTVTPKG
jgi:hypothetical protein